MDEIDEKGGRVLLARNNMVGPLITKRVFWIEKKLSKKREEGVL